MLPVVLLKFSQEAALSPKNPQSHQEIHLIVSISPIQLVLDKNYKQKPTVHIHVATLHAH